MNHLARYRINAVVCVGMGRRAIEALSTEGITVYQAKSDKVADVIRQVADGSLSEIDPTRACRGHGQRQPMDTDGGFQCGHGHGDGRGMGRGGGQGRGQGRGR